MKTRYIASVLVNDGLGNFLFIRQNKVGGAYPGTLHIPGGGIEPGEDPRSAAIREVAEEVGAQAKDVTPVDFSWDRICYRGEDTLLVFLRFTARVDSTQVVAGSDATELVWLPENEIGRGPHNPATISLLKRLDLV